MIPIEDLLHVELHSKATCGNMSAKSWHWLPAKRGKILTSTHAQKNPSSHPKSVSEVIETLRNSRLLSAEETAAWPTKEMHSGNLLSESRLHGSPEQVSIVSSIIQEDIVNKDLLLEGCERDKSPLRVAMLLSGGVDSSLALSLVKMAGHQVTAFYLQIWFQEDFRNSWDSCPWEEDLEYCRRVCERLDIPLEVVPLSEEYWDRVVHHSISEVKAGRTPNPDILCNSRVKFGAFYEYLNSNYADTFDRVASGHYARAVRSTVQTENGNPVEHVDLMLTPDEVKDQTYFLAHLHPDQLEKVMFPLGVFTKEQVRELAHWFNLPNKSRKDSQGICFLGKVKFDEFVKEHLGEWQGPLIEEESNLVLGYHKGYWFYTPGQRKGIHLSGGPWYVTRKDIRNNVVFVSKNYNNISNSEDVLLRETRSSFTCCDLNWIARDSLKERVFVSGNHGYMLDAKSLQCKVRHGPRMYNCMVSALSFDSTTGEPDTLHVELDNVDQGLASGQYAVFYMDSTCLGCGKIASNN